MEKAEIKNLIEKWNEQTMFYSNSMRMVENENYKKIVSLGKEATEAIIESLKENPSHIFMALDEIYPEVEFEFEPYNITSYIKGWIRAYENGLLK